ncbi:MAG: hypothetical protein HN352_00395 [Bacteroidetes bacterium]|nr:hypothetical protein [Bacteroidota bacterium]MBT3749583.1 hypothetical protein [Bacteroidota bacterium]MBT4399430.1 hypothetical protein [Bacteroidota bacterium]MBT4410023.1 hypothetical protein [Bacteroidota bacterium]MBT5425779.1 hypothetical protein [Bacteroidota bacterium]
MTRKIILILVIAVVPMMLSAQRQGRMFDDYFEKFKADRVSYLTDKLDLSVEEAEKFWPVYNEYQAKKEKLMEWRRESRGYGGRRDSLSVAEMETRMDQQILSELKVAELAAKYHKEFKKLLPVEKVFQLYHAERDFMSLMMRKLQNDHSQPSRGRGKAKSDKDN